MTVVAKEKYYKKIKDLAVGYKTVNTAWQTSHYGFFENVKEELFSLKVLQDFEIKLPIEFREHELVKAIQKSTKIISYSNNWDGEGSKGYSKTTYVNAISFLVKYVKWVWDEKIYALPTPKILPGSNGSIDLYWKKNSYDLIITIPEAPNLVAHYYGDDKKDRVCEGTFRFQEDNEGMFLSLLCLD